MSTPNTHPSITDPIGWKMACAAMGTVDGFHEVESQLNEQLGRAGAVLRALRRLDDILDDSLQDRAFLVDLALCAVDEIDQENEEAIARSPWDAPEIDGNVFLPGETDLKPGDMVRVRVVEAEEYDLVGERV